MAHSCERQPVFCLDIKEKGGSQSMSLQFIFGNSGSGKSHYLYQQIVEGVIRSSGEELSCSGSGAVYNADAEGPVYGTSAWRYYEY